MFFQKTFQFKNPSKQLLLSKCVTLSIIIDSKHFFFETRSKTTNCLDFYSYLHIFLFLKSKTTIASFFLGFRVMFNSCLRAKTKKSQVSQNVSPLPSLIANTHFLQAKLLKIKQIPRFPKMCHSFYH